MPAPLIVLEHIEPDPVPAELAAAVLLHRQNGRLTDPPSLRRHHHSAKLDTPPIPIEDQDEEARRLASVEDTEVDDVRIANVPRMLGRGIRADEVLGILPLLESGDPRGVVGRGAIEADRSDGPEWAADSLGAWPRLRYSAPVREPRSLQHRTP